MASKSDGLYLPDDWDVFQNADAPVNVAAANRENAAQSTNKKTTQELLDSAVTKKQAVFDSIKADPNHPYASWEKAGNELAQIKQEASANKYNSKSQAEKFKETFYNAQKPEQPIEAIHSTGMFDEEKDSDGFGRGENPKYSNYVSPEELDSLRLAQDAKSSAATQENVDAGEPVPTPYVPPSGVPNNPNPLTPKDELEDKPETIAGDSPETSAADDKPSLDSFANPIPAGSDGSYFGDSKNRKYDFNKTLPKTDKIASPSKPPVTGGGNTNVPVSKDPSKKKEGAITEPFPLPEKPQPLTQTDFEIAPFLEKVLVNPFDTSELSKLSLKELRIDNVTSYLESVLPSFSLDSLGKLPGMAEGLLAKAQGMSSFVKDLADQIPAVLSVDNLLNKVGLKDILGGMTGYLGTMNALKMELTNLPSQFTETALGAMGSIKSALNYSSIQDQLVEPFGGILEGIGITADDSIDPYAVSGIAVASVALNSRRPPVMLGVLKKHNIRDLTHVLPLVKKTTSKQFQILANGTSLARRATVVKLISDHKMIGHFPYVNTVIPKILAHGDLMTVTTANPLLTKLLAGSDRIPQLLSVIDSYGIAVVREINVALKGYGYKLTVTNYASLTARTTITTAVQSSMTAGDIVILIKDIILAVSLVGVININDLLTFITSNTLAATQTLVTSMLAHSTDVQNTITTAKPTITLSHRTVFNTVSCKQALTPIGLNTLVKTIAEVKMDQHIKSLTTLEAITASAVTAIAVQIGSSEQTNTLLSLKLSGAMLDIATKLSMREASLLGNYKVVVDLVVNYIGVLGNDLRRTLVTNILEHYKTNTDDNVLGAALAAQYYLEALNLIYPEWQSGIRDGHSVTLHSPWLTASFDSCALLTHHRDTGLAAIVQLNNRYS